VLLVLNFGICYLWELFDWFLCEYVPELFFRCLECEGGCKWFGCNIFGCFRGTRFEGPIVA